MAMRPAARPRSPLRSLLGLLLAGLPRRLIPRSFRDLAASGANDPLPQPIGHADPCQGRRFSNQGVVLWQESNTYRRGMCAVFFFSRSSHAGECSPAGDTSQSKFLAETP